MSFTDVFKKIFGTKADRDMKALKPVLNKVLEAYKDIDKLSDDQLRERCDALKVKIQEATAADEARIAQIKEELEKDIPVSQKETLATEQDKLVKKVDETIEKVLDEILPEAFAIMKSTARRFKENEVIRVKATDFDRTLSTTKEFVTIEGDYAVWQSRRWQAPLFRKPCPSKTGRNPGRPKSLPYRQWWWNWPRRYAAAIQTTAQSGLPKTGR